MTTTGKTFDYPDGNPTIHNWVRLVDNLNVNEPMF